MDRKIDYILRHVETNVNEQPFSDKRKKFLLNRPQCYGGEIGVLLSRRKSEKRKKERSDPTFVPDSLLITHKNYDSRLSYPSTTIENVPDELNCNEYLIESKETTKDSKRAQFRSQTQVVSSNTQLIRWDDVLCRPIYERKPFTSTPSASYDDDNESLNSGSSLNPDQRVRMHQLRKQEKFISFGSQPLLKKKKSGIRSSYGRNRKGKLLGLSVLTQSILADCERKNCTSNPSKFPPAPESNENHSIQSTLNCDKLIQLPKSQNIDVRMKQKTVSPKIRKSDLKSLALARSFFENLDNTEVLHVQSISCDNECDKTPALGSTPVRTRRVINTTNPELRSQYSLYCKSVKESGVEPINIEEFAKFRGNYFNKSGMFDGILEED